MKFKVVPCLCMASLLCLPAALIAQNSFPLGQLDPTRNIASPQLIDQGHTALPEQYIWNADQHPTGQTNAKAEDAHNATRYFRASFQLQSVPPKATLYVAGAENLEVYINGKLADKVEKNPASPLKMIVYTADVGGLLQTGKNTVALAITSPRTNEDETNFVAKIVPRAEGLNASPLLVSGPQWKSTAEAASNWQDPSFNDTAWKPVHAFGAIESSIDFYQANDDAGLYRWPGYIGASSFLAHTILPVHGIEQVYVGRGSYSNLDSLTSPSDQNQFTVHLASANVPEQEAPSLLLDFGREVTGRLQLISASNHPIQVTIAYGESKEEALNEPYLGVDPLTIPAGATAYGPKSAFRYANVRFVGGGRNLRFKTIALDDIYYPVKYQGSFESSDSLLNRIWEVGAYTSHLCMQDDIWDAPKRDRARWAGDLDVSGRVIDDIFDDQPLMQDTMTRLISNAPVKSHVNDIAGYSAWWISEVNQYYLHTGSKEYLQSLHEQLVQLMNYMDTEVDSRNLYADQTHTWSFVDWSPELNGDTPEARRATQFEFYLGYRDGASLLRELGDNKNAEHFDQRAQLLADAAQKYLLEPATNTFGDRWQTNSIAVFSGVADKSQYAPIWDHVLSNVATTKYTAYIMSPYYNYYIISAMAQTGHRPQTLDWIRAYWGGMIAEGATSFWEAYYPSWPKENFHASLQADNGTGYFVSLSHGWSSGPTAWMMEQILGIQPTAAGFSRTTIRPDLAGLKWAKGAEPTPHGLLKVSLQQASNLQTTIDLPQGVEATVLVPMSHPGQHLLVNGKENTSSQPAENNTRAAVVLNQPGHYVLEAK